MWIGVIISCYYYLAHSVGAVKGEKMYMQAHAMSVQIQEDLSVLGEANVAQEAHLSVCRQ